MQIALNLSVFCTQLILQLVTKGKGNHVSLVKVHGRGEDDTALLMLGLWWLAQCEEVGPIPSHLY